MREIRYRAWDKVNKRMTDVVCLNMGTWRDVILKHPDSEVLGRYETYNQETENVELIQYTGLHDKNGKMIFEADILEHCGERYIVPEFTPLDRAYEATNIKEHYDGSDDWMSMSNVDWEVIGNIYENPELLKG